MKKRIVVTGIGIVSPLGTTLNDNWERYLSGMSGIKKFEVKESGLRTFAGIVPNEELGPFIPEAKRGKIDRFSSFALVAAKEALSDAKFGEELDKEKIGVFIGSAYSGLNIIEDQLKILYSVGPRRVHPLLMQNNLTNAPAGEISIELDLKGPNIGFSSGACSSDYSIIQAFNTLQQHDIDVMIAGGTEAPLLPRVFEELKTKGLFNADNAGLNRASCPFDVSRKGFIISEGAGIIVLETLNSAEKRGADIYGELVGFGTSYNIKKGTDRQNPGLNSKVSCIKQALETASVDLTEVDYINASGVSGLEEDIEEAEVLKSVFAEEVHRIPVSSIKGSLGFSLGACGTIDAIFSLLSLKKQILPQTNNLEDIDPKCRPVCILNTTEHSPVNVILSNNFDYTGNNVSLVFKKF